MDACFSSRWRRPASTPICPGSARSARRNNALRFTDPLGRVTQPVPGDVTDPFGVRGRGYHEGVDFHSNTGTCVVASDEGIVININSAQGGKRGGNEIVMRNASGAISVYSHTMRLTQIGVGTRVREGQPMGVTDWAVVAPPRPISTTCTVRDTRGCGRIQWRTTYLTRTRIRLE